MLCKGNASSEYQKSQKNKIDKLHVTCDVENKASETTILTDGGIFKIIDVEGCKIKRYWITVKKRYFQVVKEITQSKIKSYIVKKISLGFYYSLYNELQRNNLATR